MSRGARLVVETQVAEIIRIAARNTISHLRTS